MDHPNPYAGHDSDANPDRLKALRKGQQRFLREIVSLERDKARLEARLLRAYAHLSTVTVQVGALTHPDRSGRGIEIAEKSVRAEAALRLRVSDRAVAGRMSNATAVTSFPTLMRALSRGRISSGHVWAFTSTAHLITDPEIQEVFETKVVEYAKTHSVARTKRYAKRLAEQLADTPLEERHEQAMQERQVWVNERDSGMAEVCLYTTAPVAHAIVDRLQGLAKALQSHQEHEPSSLAGERSRGNLAVDVATELLLTGTPTSTEVPAGLLAGVSATIQLIVPAITLLPADMRDRLREVPELQEIAGITSPSMLPGYGPISDEIARLFALEAKGWDETIIHPEHGRVLTVDRYQPSAAQRRFIRTRDQHCRFTGCVAPVKHAEIDHTLEAANGGATSTDNLGVACVLHHTLKHHQIHDHYRWRVTQEPQGALTWRSPFGTVTQDEPVTNLIFQPAPMITTVRAGDRRDADEPAPF